MMIDQIRTRPIRVTLLSVLVFWVACWNGLRLGEAIFFWKTLLEYGTHPLYIAVSGGVWLLAGLLLVWGFLQGRTWAWLAAILASISYGSWYWIDRLILQRPHANWPFSMIATAIFLFFVFFILFSHRTRQFFQRDNHERKFTNSAPA